MLPHVVLANIFLVSCILLLFSLFLVFHLCLPSTNLADCVGNCYTSLFFLSPLFLCFFNLEISDLLLSVPSVFSLILFCSLSCPSFSSFYYLFSFPPVYPLYFLISLLVFFSNLLSFLFSLPITRFCLLLPYVLLLFNLFYFIFLDPSI